MTSSWPPGALPSPITVDDVAALLGLDVTDEQRAAIGAELAPTVIVAGAGSGKTAVMAARVVYLVGARLVRPEQVLGLTFTNKAATELAARIRTALGRLRETPWAPDADIGDEPTVATYNAYAGRLVADHGLRIGVEPSSRLITRAQQWQLASRAVRGHRGDITHLSVQPRTVVAQLLELAAQLGDHLAGADAVRAEHGRLRERLAALGEPLDKPLAEVLGCLGKREELLTFVEAYQRLKREREVIDFSDQVAYAAQVARERPEVGAIERGHYSVVLLDEYQDTGVAQRLMLQSLYGGGHPVTAVGDPCQSIYGWRGASVGNLVNFPTDFRARDGSTAAVHYLTTNFRSGGRVLALANRTSAPLRDAGAAVQVPTLRARAGFDAAGSVVAALLPTVDDEAEWLADRVVAALGDGVAPQDVAVLARKRSQFDPIRRALEARDVPVEVVGLGGLLDTPEVNDIVAVLEVLHDPTANVALARILTGPRWRIGPRDLAALGSRARRLAAAPRAGEVPDPLADALRDADVADVGSLLDAVDDPGDPHAYSPAALERFHQLAGELRVLRQRAGQPLTDLIQDVERTIGLDVELMASPRLAGQGRAANVAAFLDEAARFVGPDRESDLAAFLAYLQAARDQDNGLDIGVPSAADTVKLLTVHAAKGLEWEVVFVPGLSQGTKSSVFPAKSTLTGWVTAPQQLPYPLRGDSADLPAWTDLSRAGKAAFLEACRDREDEEERRLAYVAVTRARTLLHLSGYHWGATQTSPFGPSVFLREAADDRLAQVDQWADAPGDGAVSPVAGRVVDLPWPVGDPAGQLGVLEAADAVRRAAVAMQPPGAPVPSGRPPLPDEQPGVEGQVSHDALLVDAVRGGAQPAPDERGLAHDERELVERWAAEAAVLLRELADRHGRTAATALPQEISVSTMVDVSRAPDELASRLARPLPQRPAPAARRGTAFHAWVEARSGQRQLLDPDELPGAADDSMGDADLAELQAHFLRTPYATKLPVEVEVPFEMTVAGHLVRGRIDAVYAGDDGGYDVIDYKTGRRPSGGDAAAAAVQLSCYRLAWAALAGVPVERVQAGFLYVADEEVVRPDHLHDEAELAALLTSLPAG